MLEGLRNVGLRNSHRVLKRGIIEVHKRGRNKRFITVLYGSLMVC